MDMHNDTGQLANSGFVPPVEPDLMMADEEDKLAIATPRQLMWWKFRKHRVAIFSGVVLIIFYICRPICRFHQPSRPQRV